MTDRFVTICHHKDHTPVVTFTGSEQAAEVALMRMYRDHSVLAGCVCKVLSEWEPKLTKKGD